MKLYHASTSIIEKLDVLYIHATSWISERGSI